MLVDIHPQKQNTRKFVAGAIYLADERQRLFPALHGIEERSDEARSGHALQLHTVIIEHLNDLFDAADSVAAVDVALDVLDHDEPAARPRLLDLPDITLALFVVVVVIVITRE